MTFTTIPDSVPIASLTAVLILSGIVGSVSESSGQEAEAARAACAELDEPAAWWSFDVGGHPEHAGGDPGALASIEGAPGFVEGRVGKGLLLVEAADGIELEPAGFPLDGDLTIETWLKTDREDGVANLIGWSSGKGGDFLVGLDAGRPFVDSGDDASEARIGDAFLSDGQWHHLGVVITRGDSLVVQILVDGDPVTSASTGRTTSQPRPEPAIGGGGERSFLGALDEIAVYARALKRTEVVAIWAAGAAGKCPPDHESDSTS